MEYYRVEPGDTGRGKFLSEGGWKSDHEFIAKTDAETKDIYNPHLWWPTTVVSFDAGWDAKEFEDVDILYIAIVSHPAPLEFCGARLFRMERMPVEYNKAGFFVREDVFSRYHKRLFENLWWRPNSGIWFPHGDAPPMICGWSGCHKSATAYTFAGTSKSRVSSKMVGTIYACSIHQAIYNHLHHELGARGKL